MRTVKIISCIIVGLLLMITSTGISLQAQDTITLDQCYLLAEQNYPLAGQIDLLAGSNELKLKNLNKNWLPVININGQVSYQSDVTKVEIALPAGFPPLEMPVLDKDWYKLSLDVNQAIWDGNVTNYKKKLEEVNLQVDQTSVKAELYKLKERINQFYFAIILLNQNEELLITARAQVEEKLNEVKAGIKYGVVLQTTADALEAEIIRLNQRMTETRIDRTGLFHMLSDLLGMDIPESSYLILPDPALPGYSYQNMRLENAVFDLQRARLEVMRNMVTTKWNPKFFAFGQAGIGRPALNMLSPDFEPFYIVGARLSWTPLNWNANKNEKKILEIQSSMLLRQQESFDKNLQIQSEKDLSEILKNLEVMEQDREIIVLRERISLAASSQLDNGVITSSEYVSRLTEERQAKLSYEIHQVQLIKAKLAYLFNQGKL